MKPKKPLKLLLNFKLRKLLRPIISDKKHYAFAVSTSDNYYDRLYDKHGEIILDEEFRVLLLRGKYLYAVTANINLLKLGDPFEVHVIDLEENKIVGTIESDNEYPEIIFLNNYKKDNLELFTICTSNKMLLCDEQGNILDEDLDDAVTLDDKLLYDKDGKTTLVTKYFKEVYDDVIATNNPSEKHMFIVGKVQNENVIYKAVGTYGSRPQDFCFKKFIEHPAGLVVRLCNKNGDEQNELAFIERNSGKVKIFYDAISLFPSYYERIFVTRKKNPRNENSETVVELCDYDDRLIAIFKNVYEEFKEPENKMSEVLAVVEDENGEMFFVNIDGIKVNMPEELKESFKKRGNKNFLCSDLKK